MNSRFYDKNGREWFSEPPVRRRRDAANVIHANMGRATPCAVKDTILETWELFLPDSTLEKMVRYSQQKADQLGLSIQLTIVQLKAYCAILYYRGVFGDQHVPIEQLWGDNYSSFYRTTMSRTLFQIWNKVFRFDNAEDRSNRKVTDTFAAIREIWAEWNEKLKLFHIPSHSITIDEQLVASRCRSPHRIYNPAKPGKYGELVRWCADASNRYFLNGSPLTKRPSDPEAAIQHRDSNKAKNLVLDLCAPFLDEGRNVTGDRFFTAVDTAEELLRRRTTYLGTMTKNKRDIPPTLHETRPKYDSTFVFGGERKQITLQSYQLNRAKKVYLLSTMHHDPTTQQEGKLKSDLQLYYNETKAGVDIVDEMCKRYSTRTSVQRWPVVHFQNILDVTAINVFTIFNQTHPRWNSSPENKRRRSFLQELSNQLAKANMVSRLRDPVGLSNEIVTNLAQATGLPNPRMIHQSVDGAGDTTTVRRCQRCKDNGKPARNSNQTPYQCSSCHQPVCKSHYKITAVTCTSCL